jgi:hypothetical protein
MDVMEMDMVAGARGYVPMPPWTPHSGCHDSNANSMAANVDETQNTSGWLGSSMVGK